MTFLLADDSRTARNILKNILRELNFNGHDHEFVEAANAHATLEALKSQHIDLLLLDWNMSVGRTGLEVLVDIRKIERLKNLPVIMVTSESEKINIIAAMKSGSSDYIVKPVNPDILKKKVQKFIDLY